MKIVMIMIAVIANIITIIAFKHSALRILNAFRKKKHCTWNNNHDKLEGVLKLPRAYHYYHLFFSGLALSTFYILLFIVDINLRKIFHGMQIRKQRVNNNLSKSQIRFSNDD